VFTSTDIDITNYRGKKGREMSGEEKNIITNKKQTRKRPKQYQIREYPQAKIANTSGLTEKTMEKNNHGECKDESHPKKFSNIKQTGRKSHNSNTWDWGRASSRTEKKRPFKKERKQTESRHNAKKVVSTQAQTPSERNGSQRDDITQNSSVAQFPRKKTKKRRGQRWGKGKKTGLKQRKKTEKYHQQIPKQPKPIRKQKHGIVSVRRVYNITVTLRKG